MNSSTQNSDLEILNNYPMRKYLYIKVGGEAKRLVYPQNTESFLKLLRRCHESGEKITVLGAGSNTIITEQGIDGVVISTRRLKEVRIDGTRVEAECGAMLSSIMNRSIRLGLTGFEFAAGIPGTVGGSIYMNAGANGGEIKDAVKKVHIWHEGEEKELSREEINFEYRKKQSARGFHSHESRVRTAQRRQKEKRGKRETVSRVQKQDPACENGQHGFGF